MIITIPLLPSSISESIDILELLPSLLSFPKVSINNVFAIFNFSGNKLALIFFLANNLVFNFSLNICAKYLCLNTFSEFNLLLGSNCSIFFKKSIASSSKKLLYFFSKVSGSVTVNISLIL